MTDANDFVYRRLVQFSDTDMAGIVHFSAYFRYMEEAEHAYRRSVGLSVYSHEGGEVLSWPRVSVHCDYHSPARFEDEIDVGVRVAELASKAATFEFDMRIGERRVATGRIVAVCCTFKEHDGRRRLASTPIPEDVAKRLRRDAS